MTALTVDLIELVSAMRGVRFALRALTFIVATMPLSFLGNASAMADPVVPPGELLGVELGTPLKPGWYLFDTTAYGGTTNGNRTGFNIPILIGASSWTVLGARVEPFLSIPTLFGVEDGNGKVQNGLYNVLTGAILAWKLTPHLGFSYLLGVYLPSDTTIAFASASTRQGFSLSYGDEDYSLTGHLTYGTTFDHVATFGDGLVQRNADYLNIELTGLRKFGSFEFGPVALGSTDLPVSHRFVAAGYAPTAEFALGALAGYDFGTASLQVYLTRDVAERGPAGPDARAWARLVVPLDTDAASALPSRVVER